METIPNKSNVNYDQIYRFNSNDIDFTKVCKPYLNNRIIKDSHKKEIENGILANGGLEKFPPISVDINTGVIVDGNYRYFAGMNLLRTGLIKDLTFKVQYYDVPEENFDDYVITLNTTSKSWSANDYINNFRRRGIESFQKLVDFCDENRFYKISKQGEKSYNPRYALAALGKKATDSKNVKFELTDEEYRNGCIVAEQCYAVKGIFSKNGENNSGNGGGWFEEFLRAWSEFHQELNKKNIDFHHYLKTAKDCFNNKKRDVPFPLGSNKKGDWNNLFRTIMTYC